MRQLKSNGAFISQSRVAAHWIVEVVNVISNQLHLFAFALEASPKLVAQKSGLERAEEALGHGNIQAFTHTAHTGLGA